MVTSEELMTLKEEVMTYFNVLFNTYLQRMNKIRRNSI
jgi:hypothetical protein